MTQNATLANRRSQLASSPWEQSLSPLVPAAGRPLLARMFSDPRSLERAEQTELVAILRQAVESHPGQAELRVLLGMACCTASDPQPALEELQTATELAPDYFLARLKLGELCMRLRMVDRAESETREASLLASHPLQIELARRQSQQIREMRRGGLLRPSLSWPLWKRRDQKQQWMNRESNAVPARLVEEVR